MPVILIKITNDNVLLAVWSWFGCWFIAYIFVYIQVASAQVQWNWNCGTSAEMSQKI